MNSLFPRLFAVFAAIAVFSSVPAAAADAAARPKKILCTTFPIYQITRNVAEGSGGVAVDLMLSAAMGCPHDYSLTPQDMAKIAAADILAINGVGMEEFMGKPLLLANPDIVVVDSSAGIADLLAYDEDEDGEHDHGHDHGHAGDNPHLFVSPLLNAALAENIAGRLCVLDPAGAAIYAENAARYAGRLRALAAEMRETVAGFANKRVIEPHGSFDYLFRDIGIEVVAHLQPHGQELSAALMLDLLRVIREKNPAAIVVEPGYSAKAAGTLEEETALPVIRLDPAASGPDDAGPDHYESVMRNNLSILRRHLGG